MKKIENNIFNLEITEPTELINCSCLVVNITDKPIWIRFKLSTIKAKTNHQFMMEHFTNYDHFFNIPILPQ